MSSRTYSDSPPVEVFWGEIAPPEHAVHFYESEEALLGMLEGFVTSGLTGGESVIVIATEARLAALAERLRQDGVSLSVACSRHRYIPLDAKDVLGRFVIRGWPDGDLFREVVVDLIARARKGASRVRVFSEITSLLLERGRAEGAQRLEHLWHGICDYLDFSLMCAYPKRLVEDAGSECVVREICEKHTKEVGTGGSRAAA